MNNTNINNSKSLIELHYTLNEDDIYEYNVLIFNENDEEKITCAAITFYALFNSIKNIAPHVCISNFSLSLGKKCIVELFFHNINDTDYTNIKRYYKKSGNLSSLINDITDDIISAGGFYVL